MESANQTSCFDCELRPSRLFCDLPADALHAFDHIKSIIEFGRGTTLFQEGQPSRGVFLLCRGRAKLSISSEQGHCLLLRIAGPGEMLGLSASLSGFRYELTAEAADPVQVAFIRRKDLLSFLRHHREACTQVIHLLSQDLHSAYDQVRNLGWARTRSRTSASTTRLQ